MSEIVPYATRPAGIDGLVVITLKQVTDERGTIREFFRRSTHDTSGLPDLGAFLQINVTETVRGAVRGLHAEAMTKLVSVVSGEALGAYVDLRPGSPTLSRVETVALVPGVQVLVPPGVANGFQALEDATQYVYAFDDEWQPGMAGAACSPLDPALGLDWPIPIDPDNRAQVSAKDLARHPSPTSSETPVPDYIAFAGHNTCCLRSCWPLARWRSLARNDGGIHA